VAPAPAAVPAPAVPAAPSKAPASRPATSGARIVLVARDGGEGPVHAVGETTDLGRTEGQVLLPDDAYISPRHARISARGGAFFLRDLASTNGVFFRIPFVFAHEPAERAVERAGQEGKLAPEGPESGGWAEQPIKDQDLFLVGQQVLRFEVVKDAEEGFGVASDNGTLLFGTPLSPRYARLTLRTVEGVVRDVFTVRKTETVLGRESGDIVFTDDPFLSRRHAALRMHAPPPGAASQERRFTLSDLGSSNGTFLRVQEEVRLRNGDHFRIGQQLFRFDLGMAQNGA
jgi:pSer/pThr/pTyr-binding forkhead associated (FHA) protein